MTVETRYTCNRCGRDEGQAERNNPATMFVVRIEAVGPAFRVSQPMTHLCTWCTEGVHRFISGADLKEPRQ